jgi:hypothetical protein
MSEDPIGFAGGLNRYTYAGNDPINWLDYAGTARELPGWGKGLISALSAIGGMIGIIDGGLGGGGLGLLGGPAAPVTVPLGAIAGAAAAGAEGATAGAALGFGIVLLFDDPSDLFQQASSSGGSGGGSPPNRIYSSRVLNRSADEPGPYHNFPFSFDEEIFRHGTRTVVKGDYVVYRLRGTLNGQEGTFEIGVRPSDSGRTETITHRFFKPDRR